MLTKIYLVCLLMVGLINFLPVIGLLGAEKLNTSYGLSLADQNIILLMRHRALLFGIVGGFVFYSLFNSHMQLAALLLAAISMLGFLVLFHTTSGINTQLASIAKADYIGLIFLAAAIVLKWRGA